MGWLFGSKETPRQVVPGEKHTDLNKLSELITQLGESMKAVSADVEKAKQATAIVDGIQAQLSEAMGKKARATELLAESQQSAQDIINNIGLIKLDLGVY